jgi:hypothetical protein
MMIIRGRGSEEWHGIMAEGCVKTFERFKPQSTAPAFFSFPCLALEEAE